MYLINPQLEYYCVMPKLKLLLKIMMELPVILISWLRLILILLKDIFFMAIANGYLKISNPLMKHTSKPLD
jgi:hypothetical protein